MPNFAHFNQPVKIRKMIGKCLGINEYQSSALQVEVLDFRYVAPFRNQRASKATVVNNEAKFRTF